MSGLVSPGRPSYVGSPASDRYKGLSESAVTPNAFVPRPSIKKLTVTPKSGVSLRSEDHLESVLGRSALRGSPQPGLDRSTPPAAQSPGTQLFAPNAASPSRPAINGLGRPSETVGASPSAGAATERNVKDGEYWCRPKVERLRQLGQRELSAVPNFTAGRTGYGEVTWLEPVDLTGLDLKTFLGDVIVFTEMELAVYPDDYPDKPPMGQGLNVPAQITLENCFPKDKATKQPITDTSDPRHARFLKRVKNIPDTEFVSYTDDGMWTFKVEHFSRYGLRDSDEESEEDGVASASAARRRLKEREAFRRTGSATTDEEEEEEDEDMLPPTKSIHDKDAMGHDSGIEESLSEEDDEELPTEADESSVEEMDADDFDPDAAWDRPIKAKLGVEGMRKLREMQAGFFGDHKATVEVVPPKQAAVVRAKRALEDRLALGQGFGNAGEEHGTLDDRAVRVSTDRWDKYSATYAELVLSAPPSASL